HQDRNTSTNIRRVVIKWAVCESESKRVPSRHGLNPRHLPATEHPVKNAAAIHELPSFAEWQLVSRRGDEAVPHIVAGASFIQVAVGHRRDAGAGSAVVIATVERF